MGSHQNFKWVDHFRCSLKDRPTSSLCRGDGSVRGGQGVHRRDVMKEWTGLGNRLEYGGGGESEGVRIISIEMIFESMRSGEITK